MNTASNEQGFSNVQGIVTVDEHVPSAGSIIWWRLSGEVDFDVIRSAWLAAGLEEKDLLTPCAPSTALKRAVEDLREKRRLVRPLGRNNGFAIVRERVTKDKKELEHMVLCTIMLDAAGRVQIETVDGTAEEVKNLTAEVRGAFEKHLVTLSPTDFSGWLVRMLPRLDAVGLREGGGVYFVPYTAVERIGEVVQVLRAVSSHVVNRVPAMRSDDAVEAILDAITQEADAEANGLERDIDAMKLGEKGFENRVAHCDAVESKVTRYEALLGRQLDTVRDRLEALRARLTIAVLKTKGNDGDQASSLAGL